MADPYLDGLDADVGFVRFGPREIAQQLRLTNAFYEATDADVRATGKADLIAAWETLWARWKAFYSGNGRWYSVPSRFRDSTYDRTEMFQAHAENFRKALVKTKKAVTPTKQIVNKANATPLPPNRPSVPGKGISFNPSLNVDGFPWGKVLIVAGVAGAGYVGYRYVTAPKRAFKKQLEGRPNGEETQT